MMMAVRRCWWCGRSAEVNTEQPESNGLLRDDSTFDGSESWICAGELAAACAVARRRSTVRPVRTPEEQDAFTGWRHYLRWRPGQRKAVKHRANRRDRRAARRQLREENR